MFEDLERFVATDRLCGELTSDVGEMTESGYSARLACSCGAVFERRVTPEAADDDLLRSTLPGFSG